MASHPATRTTCLPRQLANSPALARHAHQYLAEAGFEPALVALQDGRQDAGYRQADEFCIHFWKSFR